MAFSHFPSFLLFLILPYFFSHLILANEKESPLKFLKYVEGGKKGDNINGIREVKQYLQQFGYLDCKKQINDNDFDESLESALQIYQLNFHLKPTGILDGSTLSNIAKPRCGVPDIINGINTMKPRNPNFTHHLHMVSHYVVNPTRLKWPPSKYNLTFLFIQRNHPIHIYNSNPTIIEPLVIHNFILQVINQKLRCIK